MFDPKRWALFAFLRTLIRGKLGLMKGVILIPLLIFFFFIFPFYITIKLIEAVTRYLFVRGDGRKIWSGFRPNIRQTTIRRGAARGVDFLIVGLVVVLTASLIQIPISNTSLGIGLSILYFVGSVHVSETTLGKSIMGLKLVSTSGDRLTPYQSVVRELTSVISIYIFPIALYVVVKNQNGEQIGDIIADTHMVTSKPDGLSGLSGFLTDVRNSVTMVEKNSTSVPVQSDGTILQEDYTRSRSTIIQNESSNSSSKSNASGKYHQQSNNNSISETPPTDSSPEPNQSVGHGTAVYHEQTESSSHTSNTEAKSSSSDQSQTLCHNCSHEITSPSRYCPNCGTKNPSK